MTVKRQIFIHIGTHKTGTTSIQSLLCQRASRLQQLGIYVPQAGRAFPNFAGHHNIGWMLRGEERADPTLGGPEDLATELAGTTAQKAVISAEGLQFLVERPELIEKLEHTLQQVGWQARYVVFLRDPASYAISLYNEMLKRQPGLPLKDFIAPILQDGRFLRFGDHSFYFDYEAFLARWRTGGRGRIDIYSYNTASAGAGVPETFLTAIGAPAALSITRQARTPRQIWREILARMRQNSASPIVSATRLNQNTNPVPEEMRQQAARVGAAFQSGFERLTAHCA
ncbi:hypothetical protein ACT6QH_09640 [Xanthobacter sp. TB0139]|uniref:hypothetical protein n=1 Tax=Xanthobacter sp. TB0139 TaxID=3459178 RepID=UPI004039C5BF